MKPRTFAPFIVLAGLACHADATAPSSAAGLVLAVAVAQSELSRGQADTITMTLTNTNSHAVSLSGGACEPRPYVRDASGVTVVPPGGDWVCIALLRTLRLGAGERYTRTFVWQTSLFAPGVYAVHATFSAQDVRLATPPASVRLN